MEEANDRRRGRVDVAKSKWNTGHKIQAAARAGYAGLGIAGSGVAFAVRAAQSEPLRNAVRNGAGVAFRGAKVAATVAATSALASNPITMPLALAAGAKLATSRDTWRTIASVSHGGLYLKGSLKKLGRLERNPFSPNPSDGTGEATPRPDGKPTESTPSTGTSTGMGGGSPTSTPTVDGGGADGTEPASDDAPTKSVPKTDDAATETIPKTDDGDAPATQPPTSDVNYTGGYNSAVRIVRSGMMADFINNQHMSREEAEQAYRRAIDSGEFEKAVDTFMRERGRRNPSARGNARPQSSGPLGVIDTSVVEADTGSIVGEMLPSGTKEAAVDATAAWQEIAGTGDTVPPDSVNDALQQEYMRRNPVWQTPEEHLRMARAEWTSRTGMPGDLMPPGAERAMNPNHVMPDSGPETSQPKTDGKPEPPSGPSSSK